VPKEGMVKNRGSSQLLVQNTSMSLFLD